MLPPDQVSGPLMVTVPVPSMVPPVMEKALARVSVPLNTWVPLAARFRVPTPELPALPIRVLEPPLEAEGTGAAVDGPVVEEVPIDVGDAAVTAGRLEDGSNIPTSERGIIRRIGRGPSMHRSPQTCSALVWPTTGPDRTGRRPHCHPPRSRRSRRSLVLEEVNYPTHSPAKNGSYFIGGTGRLI